MKLAVKLLVFLSTATLGVGCAAVTTGTEIPDGIVRLMRQIEAADSSENLDAVLKLYTEDAVWIFPDEPPIKGRAAIRDSYATLFSANDVEVRIDVDEVLVGRNVAVVLGRTHVTLRPRLGGTEGTNTDVFLMGLKKKFGRSWRICYLMWRPEIRK